MSSDPAEAQSARAVGTAPARGAAPRRSLRMNMVYAVVGNGLFNVCRFGVAVLLAKFATPAILGQYTYGQALAGPVVMFCALHLRATIVADAANEYTYGTYRKLRSLGMGLAAVVIAGMTAWEYLRGASVAYAAILAGVGAEKIFSSFSELAWGLYQKREDLRRLAIANILQGLCMLAPFGVALPLYGWLVQSGRLPESRIADGTAIAVVSYALGYLCVYLFHDRPRVRGRGDLDERWNWPAVRKLFVHVVPLGLILMIINLCETVPRVMLKAQPGGQDALGFFSALGYVTQAVNLLLIQAGLAAGHRLATYFQTNVPAFIRLTLKLTVFTIGMAATTFCGAWLLGKWLLRVLYTDKYAEYDQEFMIMVFGQCVSMFASTFGIVTFQMRRFWMQFAIHAVVLATTVISVCAMIPGSARPVHAAAWTIVIRNVVHAGLYTVALLAGIRERRRRQTT